MKGRQLISSFFTGTILAACAAALLAPAQGIGDRNRPSEGGSHIISGKVYLPNGKAAAGARVSISSSDIAGSTVSTDNDGGFSFSGLPGGNYWISVAATGFPTESEAVTIERFASPGQGFQLAFHLRLLDQPKPETASAEPLLAGVPKEAASRYLKGLEKAAKNDPRGAVFEFDSAIAAYSAFAAAHYQKGSVLLKANELDTALAAFVRAIEIKPDFIEAKYGYGLAQFEKKNYEVAAAAFADIVQQRKDIAEAHLYLGISLFNLKNNNAAESELRTAVTAQGGEKLALAHLYLGQIYTLKKKNVEAVSELEKYLELVPKAPNANRVRSAIADLKKLS
jgi:tetratricopeptide (TPR) repeat protein